MKPLKSESQDAETLRELGSASVQIVHDLKNQLNGLKLYATFLRKRMEKNQRPADEIETVGKLMAGLERAAANMTLLVRYGRTVELQRLPGTDLVRLLSEACGGDGAQLDADDGAYAGDFDATLLSEALKNITAGGRVEAETRGDGSEGESTVRVKLRREEAAGKSFAVVEWRGVTALDEEEDPFRSFAGGAGLRMALAAKVVRAHGGEVSHEGGVIRARLPIKK